MEREFVAPPVSRRLQIFSFDPGLAGQFENAGIGELTVNVPWEGLEPGPVGEYIEVVDVDPASGVMYRPVNLDNPMLLAQDGLPPSETNPQFHQQMVYAVAMATIGHFERALGRPALWASREYTEEGKRYESYIQRLRIYPHALREQNAYYSPDKKALLFGYFPVERKDKFNSPGTVVFTCLSHDIIAHETTHALLDGVHPRFNRSVNPDVLAFHEAFADIVALFQHFSYPGVLRDQISRTRGDLVGDNLLAQLAQQFGRASGRGGALRDALGKRDKETGVWMRRAPNTNELDTVLEPHDRGSILVAAVFGAFTKVYRARTVDLYRIATQGTGILPEGEIHPDLAKRLADEAARAALYVLQMCIRALDYCPPVGITFGDYLRAIVTADFDVNPEDEAGFRLAFVESFREWGIHPRAMRSMSIDSLLWPTGDESMSEVGLGGNLDLSTIFGSAHDTDEVAYSSGTRKAASYVDRLLPWTLESDRRKSWEGMEDSARQMWGWLVNGEGRKYAKAAGLVLDEDPKRRTIFKPPKGKVGLAVEVHSVRRAVRKTAKGGTIDCLVVEVTQRRRGYYDADEQRRKDLGEEEIKSGDNGNFRFRAGCTLIIESDSLHLRRVIRTATPIDDNDELERLRIFLTRGVKPPNAYDPGTRIIYSREPFALLHREGD